MGERLRKGLSIFAVTLFVLLAVSSSVGADSSVVGADSFSKLLKTYEATDPALYHMVGHEEGTDWYAVPDDPEGHMIYGPYIDLPSGMYKVTFRMKVDDNTGSDKVCGLDVTSDMGKTILKAREVKKNQFSQADVFQDFTLIFVAGKKISNVEFRVYYNGNANLTVDSIRLERIDTIVLKFKATDPALYHMVGHEEGTDWYAVPDDPEGHMIYGPYIDLPSGMYKVTFRMKVDDNTGSDKVCGLDVTSDMGKTILKAREVKKNQFSQADVFQDFSFTFNTEESLKNVEFRVFYFSSSGAKLTVDYIKLEKDSDGDGLSDVEEITGTYGYKTDAHDRDSDDDGLDDFREYWWLCNPNNWDTNGDHISDGESVDKRMTYPFREEDLRGRDIDGDHLPDMAEIYDVKTDPKTFSTDGDPYGDGQEYFRINMPNIGSADHPLVAAYPILAAQCTDITVIPKAEITTATGNSIQKAWSITTETSDSTTHTHQVGGSVNAGIGKGGDDKTQFGVSVTVSYSYSRSDTTTTTFSKTESGFTQEDWSTATTINTDDAAKLKFTMKIKNSGTAPAEEITPNINIKLGDKIIATVTSPITINSLGIGDSSKDFVVGGDGEITASLDELKSIDCGTPLTIEAFQIDAKVKKWDGERKEWVLTGTDYSTYMNEINAVCANIVFDSGDGEYREYKVFAGSDRYDPGITLEDALRLTIGIERRGDGVYFGRYNIDNWRIEVSPEEAFNAAKRLAERNEELLNLKLKPGWTIVIRPSGTLPKIHWAEYTEDMKGVVASVTDDRGLKKVVAHVKIGGTFKDIEMTDDDKDTIYQYRGDNIIEESSDAYVLAEDTEDKSATSKIRKSALPKPPIEKGTYVICNKFSGKCVEAENDDPNIRANVRQWEYVKDRMDRQQWIVEPIGRTGYYKIYRIVKVGGETCQLCLEAVKEGRVVNVVQAKCSDNDRQKWKIEPIPGEEGYFKVINKANGGRYLDVEYGKTNNGANIWLVDQWIEHDAKKWTFQPVDSYPREISSTGYYTLVVKHSNKCMNVDIGNKMGKGKDYVCQWTCKELDWQKWRLVALGDGYFKIVSKHSGKCLTATDGKNIIVQDWKNSDAQKWNLIEREPGYYNIQCKKYKGLYIDVKDGSLEDGGHLWLRTYSSALNNAAQRWNFYPTGLVIQLYEHANFKGKLKVLSDDAPTLGDFDDIVSSLKVSPGYVVALYENEDYQGEQIFLKGSVSYVGEYFNDRASSLKIFSEKDLKPGKMVFYEGNDATQDRLFTLSTDKSDSWDCKHSDACENDEARSVKLYHVKPGTRIYVYDSPEGSTDDDWTEILVKQYTSKITINSFEEDRDDDEVSVNYHPPPPDGKKKNLDGKVSYIKVVPPPGW